MPCILLTRPRNKSEAFAAQIAECGWTSAIWPLLKIQNRLTRPVTPEGEQSLIFTSAAAIAALPDPAPVAAAAICVGPATAEAARRRGFSHVTNIGGDADALVQSLSDAPARKYLHVRGAQSRGDVAARLTAAGRPTDDVIAYEAIATRQPPAAIDTAFQLRKIQAVALFSPRSAAIFQKCAKSGWLDGAVTAFVISAAVAEPVRDIGFDRVVVADQPDGNAMRAAICSAIKEQRAIGLNR